MLRTTNAGKPRCPATLATAALSISSATAPVAANKAAFSAAVETIVRLSVTAPSLSDKCPFRREDTRLCQSAATGRVLPPVSSTDRGRTRSPGFKRGSSAAAQPQLIKAVAPASARRAAALNAASRPASATISRVPSSRSRHIAPWQGPGGEAAALGRQGDDDSDPPHAANA